MNLADKDSLHYPATGKPTLPHRWISTLGRIGHCVEEFLLSQKPCTGNTPRTICLLPAKARTRLNRQKRINLPGGDKVDYIAYLIGVHGGIQLRFELLSAKEISCTSFVRIIKKIIGYKLSCSVPVHFHGDRFVSFEHLRGQNTIATSEGDNIPGNRSKRGEGFSTLLLLLADIKGVKFSREDATAAPDMPFKNCQRFFDRLTTPV